VLVLADRREHRSVNVALPLLRTRVPHARVTVVSTTDGTETAGKPLPWNEIGWGRVHPKTDCVLAAHWPVAGLDGAAVHAEVMRRCKSLRWLHTMSTGVEHLPLLALAGQGVVITHHTGVSDAPLAEFALAGLLHFVKQLPRLHKAQAEGRWSRFEHRTLSGSTLAVVGFGSIGRAVGRAATALGMRVVAISRRELQADELAAGGASTCLCIGAADLDDGESSSRVGERLCQALAAADHVVMALPHTLETAGILGAAQLSALRDGAVIVNVGRGSSIDETALVEALSARPRSLFFCGDVFEQEPLPAQSALWGLPNVLVSAHCMDWTAHAKDLTAEAWVRNVEAFASRGTARLTGLVHPQLGY
jgi:glyoxylate/hydroxypyruvate reductase A